MSRAQSAVIFDVDGVLVDSYAAHYESWRAIAREQQIRFTEEDFARTFGRTSRDIVRALWPGGTTLRDSEIRAIDDRKEAFYREIVADHFPAMEGAAELIDALRTASFLLAAGSSGPPENVELCLAKLEKRDCFSAVVTGMDVTRGKPDPQVFLLAAERLGIGPHRCVVVEDAPAGIEAARRGGMKAIGLLSRGRTARELGAADIVVHSLRDLSPERICGLLYEDGDGLF
jgi:beta-phosphoglucomutase